MSDLTGLVSRPVPCGGCSRSFPPGELAERVVPAGMVDFDLDDNGPTFVLHEVVWLCASCRSALSA